LQLDTSRHEDYINSMTTAQERKQQERQARRRRIQEAAREVFTEKGYAKTSIEQVARRATLSVGAIYLYFRSKEDLYVSLLEETLEKFDQDLNEIRTRSDLTPVSRLQTAWAYFVEWAETDPEGTRTIRLVSQPDIRKQLSDEVVEATSRGLTSIRDHFRELLSAGMEGGSYRRVDAGETADLLWSLYIGLLQTTDARLNLGISGASFAQSARSAFSAIEGGLRPSASRGVAEEVAA
jgi:AcrR family transcriptional regulator